MEVSSQLQRHPDEIVFIRTNWIVVCVGPIAGLVSVSNKCNDFQLNFV